MMVPLTFQEHASNNQSQDYQLFLMCIFEVKTPKENNRTLSTCKQNMGVNQLGMK